MNISELLVALFSGNYNYTSDGANLSLNRLVAFLLSHGAAVRIYSPTSKEPAFTAVGDLVGVRSMPIPGRSDYRIAYGMGRKLARDLNNFKPNIVHISAPETLGHWGSAYARKYKIPLVASVHTRFDAYLHYYRLGFLEPLITGLLRRFYQRCDAIVAPSSSMAAILSKQEMHDDIDIWPSGVDHDFFPRRHAHSTGDVRWALQTTMSSLAFSVGWFWRREFQYSAIRSPSSDGAILSSMFWWSATGQPEICLPAASQKRLS